jgi:nucleotide-binding universal stress UspA family protein
VWGRHIVLVPADGKTNVALAVQAATLLSGANNVEIHVLDVVPPADRLIAGEDPLGLPWTAGGSTSAMFATSDVVVRDVQLRGAKDYIIPAYAQLVGAHGIVVPGDYGARALRRNTALLARIGRRSPVPVLVLPSDAPQRWSRGDIRSVIAAVDATVASVVTLRTAVVLATRFDATLTMLHALEQFPGHSVFSGAGALRVVQQLPAQQRQLSKRLKLEARRLGAHDVVPRVITGDAAFGIATASAEADADLIVMGVAPRTWVDRTLFGSTLSRVLRRARVPVLVVPVAGGQEEWSATTVEAVTEDAAVAGSSLSARPSTPRRVAESRH